MDDRDLHDFFGPAQRHRLTVREKERSFDWLDDRIARGYGQYDGSFLWRTLRVIFSGWTPVAAAVVICVVTGAGLSFAQNAVPGDPLYPLKRLGEQMRFRISLDEASKADVGVDHLNARLEEAATMELKGTLTGKAAVMLDQDFRSEHSEAAVRIEALERQPRALHLEEKISKIRERLKKSEERYERTLKTHTRQAVPAMMNTEVEKAVEMKINARAKIDATVDANIDAQIDATIDVNADASSASGSVRVQSREKIDRNIPKEIKKSAVPGVLP